MMLKLHLPFGIAIGTRQDPDIIMVGEIRDEETAEIAINSALTGHLVFQRSTPTRRRHLPPLDRPWDQSVITSAVNIAMAQRLVRTLSAMQKSVPIAGADKVLIDTIIATLRSKCAYTKRDDVCGGWL